MTWTEETYEWTQDDWGGAADFAATPESTWRSGEGDCEDYALVAASWLSAIRATPIYLGYCGNGYSPEHVICYDKADDTVYSNGNVIEDGFETYKEREGYDWIFTRRVD